MNVYNPSEIEEKWQKCWEDENLFATPTDVTSENKQYILPQLPYPSGSGLHVGHAEVYTACDIYARYQRMIGKSVLQAVGWDSFGLPAENYAIKTNIHPKDSIKTTTDNFRNQIKMLGVSADWDKEIATSDPSYYKWTQWLFLLLHERGLAYRKQQSVNWCEKDKTVLANDQVKQGECERCGTTVVQKDMEQWYIRITDYAEQLLEGLDRIDWPEETKKRQRDWIGRSEGVQIAFKIQNSKFKIDVFTTRPDTLFGATFMVLAPEHLLVQNLKSEIKNRAEVEAYVQETARKTDLDRQVEQKKTGVELKGINAIHPITGDELPIWIADYVLVSYGSGAIMAVPGHDERDEAFATVHGLPIVSVYDEDGKVIAPDFLNGLEQDEAVANMTAYLEENELGKGKVQYKLRDWSVSRQRFWGSPIPMLYDEAGELHPVPKEDLPVLLPDDVDFKPTGESPLVHSEAFQKGVEKTYGKGWRREVDTLDTFMCSSWYFFRYLDPHNDKEFASPEQLSTWMPVDFYLGGAEHVNGHLLYARFITKVLHDAGYVQFDEPFTKHRHQGLIMGEEGRKMSKRWGNVINPSDVVDKYGADTTRMYEMFMGALEEDKPWSDGGVKGVRRFLEKLWKLQEKLVDKDSQDDALLHGTIKKITQDTESLQFNTAIAKMMELVNVWQKQKDVAKGDYEILLKLLAPYAPHIAEELWETIGNTTSVTLEQWPTYDESLTQVDIVIVVVQVNGKVRAKLEVASSISQKDVEDMALSDSNVEKWVDGKEIKKIIYVEGALLSIVV